MSAGFDPLYKWLGIPPDEQPPHCYRLLGLEIFEENLDVIESAADRQMAYLRTFQTGPNVQLAQEVLNQVAVAKSWLLNPERKVQYDAWLREQLGLSPPSAPPVAAPAPQVQEAGLDFGDLLGNTDPYVQSRRRIKKGRRRQWLGVGISLVAAILAVGILVVVALKLQEGSSQEGTLEVEWPEAEREGGSLQLDGKPAAVAPGDKTAFSLPMGRHQVTFTRPGYKPYELTEGVTAGRTSTVRPVWRKAGARDEEAKSESSDEKGNSMAKKSGSAKDETDEFSFDKKDKPQVKDKPEVPTKDESAEGKKSAGDEKAEAKPAASPKASDPTERLELPNEAARQKARQTVREVYKSQLDAAGSASDKQVLAKRLLQEAMQTQNDPEGQFALLQTAEELAVESGDGLTAFSAIEEMSQRYRVDALDLKSRVLDTFAKKARLPEQHKSVADEALRLADEATAEGRLPLATQLSKLATREATKGRDKETLQRSRARAKELEEITAAYEDVKVATATLAEKPEDPQANLVLGKYHCFLRGDWQTGLPMLARGSDANLKALARRDLEGASVPEAQAALADEWRALAGKSSGLAKRQLQSRAAHWYHKALPGLSGLAKAAADRWLKEFGAPQDAKESPSEE